MTYSTGGLIQATDFNNFVGTDTDTTTSPIRLNTLWGPGTGDRGFGQAITVSANVVSGTTEVTASQWASLLNLINTIRQHEGASAPFTGGNIPTTGDVINATNAIQTQLDACDTNRYLNSAAAGTTTTGSTKTTNWTFSNNTNFDSTMNMVVTFGSSNALRYFFNNGGRLQFIIVSANATGGTTRASQAESLLESGINNLTLRPSISQFGGTGSHTSRGYWTIQNAGGGGQVAATATLSGTYASSTAATLTVSTSATTVTFSLRLQMGQGTGTGFDDTGGVTLITRVDTIEPPTTYVSKSWGTPTSIV